MRHLIKHALLAAVLSLGAPAAAQQLPPGLLDRMAHAEQTLLLINCTSPEALDIMATNIPALLELGPGSAHIVALQSQGEGHYQPVSNPGTEGILCSEIVTWSNGARDIGEFREWPGRYGGMMVSWQTQAHLLPVPEAGN